MRSPVDQVVRVGARAASIRLLVLAVIISTGAAAQNGAGYLFGTIRDASDAVVPAADVTLRNRDTGTKRTTTSDGRGVYSFAAVLPGNYDLRVDSKGFSPVDVSGIVVNIGSEINRDVTMKIGLVNEALTIAATIPLVNTSGHEVGGIVSQSQMANLPLNSRQYLSLALLLPGTSIDGTRAFFSSVNVGGSMTFNSTANLVDGMANNWAEDGETRQDIPADAVQEFKVNTGQYSAEFGLATGGMIQVATKAGTNQFHGSAFEYFRDKALNARGVFESAKPDFRRHQYGGSIGGPILKDRLHFFFAGERTGQTTFYTVTTGLPQFYSALEGTFASPSHRSLYVARGDWQSSERQSVFIRYAHEDEYTDCAGCGGTTAAAAGYDQETPRRSLVVGHTWTLSPNRLNEARFQYARGGYYISPHGSSVWNDVGAFPPERIQRVTRTYIFPSLTYGSSQDILGPESRYQFRDTYVLNLSRHNASFGADYSYLPYAVDRVGNPAGTYTFSQDQYFNPRDPVSLASLRGAVTFSAILPPIHASKPTQYGVVFGQDEWRLRSNLTLTFGIRYERFYGAANEDLDTSGFPVTLPFVDVSKRGNRLNVAPRLGFAWAPKADGRTVVRGGYGIYYGHVRIGANLNEFFNYKQYTVNITNPPYPDPYQGQDPMKFIVAGPANIGILANDFRQPYSQVFSLGGSHQISSDFAVHVDGIYNLTLRDRKIQDINPRNSAGVRALQAFGRIDEHESTAQMKYRGVYVKAEKRYSHRTQFLVSYTYTNSADNNPLVRYIDPFDQKLDWGPSNAERRHGVVASGTVLLPWNVNFSCIWTLRSQLPWTAVAGRDLNRDGFNTDLVPGTTRNSGGRDLDIGAVNRWRQSNSLGPISGDQIDSSRVNLVDTRLSKPIPLSERIRLDLVLQAFNSLNTRNLQDQFGGGRVTNSLSQFVGHILTARPSRQLELAARLTW